MTFKKLLRKKILYLTSIIAVGLVVYFNGLFNGFTWDDINQIVNNHEIRSLKNIPRFFLGGTFYAGGAEELGGLFYRPLQSTSYAIIYTLFGLNPFFFHLYQVLLHIGNALLVFLFLTSFLSLPLSLFATLAFLIHPMQVETVTSVCCDIHYFFFGMMALLTTSLALSAKEGRKILLFSLIFILFLLSLLSREDAILFMGVGLFYVFLFKGLKKDLLLYLLSSGLPMIVYLFLRFGVAHMEFGHSSGDPITQIGLWERVLHGPLLFVLYLRTFVFPKDLVVQQHWVIKNFDLQNLYFPLILSILILLIGIFLGRRVWRKNPTTGKAYAFFFVWFLVGVGSHLQIVPLDFTFADRWFYFPMIGLLAMAAFVWQTFAKVKKTLIRDSAILLVILVISLLSVRTFVRNFDWKDNLTLYSHDIQLNKDSYSLERALAFAYAEKGDFKKAEYYIQRSTKLAPQFTNWNFYGVLYEKTGDKEKSIYYYKKAMEQRKYYAYENLGRLLSVSGRHKEALEVAKVGLKYYPKNSQLWRVLAVSEYFLGNQKEGAEAAKKAFEITQDKVGYDLYILMKSGRKFILK